MKKSIFLLLILASFLSMNLSAYGQELPPIRIVLDGTVLTLDVPPTVIENRTMVPVRAIFEALGADVQWLQQSMTIIGIKGDLHVQLQVNNKSAFINGKEIQLDVPATVLLERTLVPARFIAESLGAKVDWNPQGREVVITSAPKDIYVGITKRDFLNTLEDMLKESGLPFTPASVTTTPDKTLDQYISKQEAELLFIRSMGYQTNLQQVIYQKNLFDNRIISNTNPTQKLILSMYEKINRPLTELHGFYAINSFPQLDLLPGLDAVSFGWSRLEFQANDQVVLSMDKGGDFYLPEDFSKPVTLAKNHQLTTNLMVYATQAVKNDKNVGMIEYLFANPEVQRKVIDQIVEKVNHTYDSKGSITFSGVVVDFEDMRETTLSEKYNDFLRQLKTKLELSGKKLYVAVPPKKYYKGYDYRSIGDIADKVILMAHDYHPKKLENLGISDPVKNFSKIESPLTPILNTYNQGFDVYNALKEITDEKTGVVDKTKIILQISFDAIQWTKDHSNSIKTYHPSYEAIKQRLENPQTKENLKMMYSEKYENPYFTYYDSTNQTEHIIWYEDSRSVLAKIHLAKLFDIQGISLWRLGNIPAYEESGEKDIFLDTWQQLLEQR